MASAASVPSEESRYVPQRYGPAQGLSGGSVNAIAQTPDGYLWIGTDQTLWRFDGQTLQAVALDPELGPLSRIVSLTVDKQGALWIHRQGETLIRYEHGQFTATPWPIGTQTQITAVGARPTKGILLSANQGIGRTGDGEFEQIAPPPTDVVLSIAETSDRRVWVGTNNAGLLYLKGRDQVSSGLKLPDKKVNCLLAGKNGQLWIGTDDGLALWTGSEMSGLPMPQPLDRAQVLAMILDRHGDLWVGTAKGLVRYHAGVATVMAPARVASSPAVTALFEDREGNIWAGDSLGMQRWRETAFETFSRANGLPEDSYGAIAEDAAGRTWIAPRSGGLYWLRGGQVHRLTLDGIASEIIYSIATVGSDELWLGRQSGGLTHLHVGDRSIAATTYGQKDGLAQDSIYTVFVDHDGGVWAGSLSAGVSYVKDGRFTNYSIANGLISNAVSAIAETADGSIWFATPSGLSSLSKAGWHRYSTREGLPSSNITSLFTDTEGVLWIGTSAGLAHFYHGGIQPTARLPELVNQLILGIAEDKTGSLWITTSSRLLKIKRSALLMDMESPQDSNESVLTNQPYSNGGIRRDRTLLADSLGHIWIATSEGLSSVNPELLDDRSVPGMVHVTGVTVDGNPSVSTNDLQIAPGEHRVTFDFVGMSFAAPQQVRYTYRLVNFDRDWSVPGEGKQATYTNLAPGKYRFRVVASNSEGRWNGAEDSVAITVDPLLWQTTRFLLLAAVALVLLSIGAYRFKVRQITREVAVGFQERLAERTRIAQELHDTFLQGLYSASLQLGAAADQVPVDSPAKSMLERVLDVMDTVADEGRDTVRGLRTADVGIQCLDGEFRKVLDEIPGSATVESEVMVVGTPRSLHFFVYDEVLRIGREALTNSLRHAEAANLEVRIEFDARRLRIAFKDDGCGIEPEVQLRGRDGHWGMLGMQERAKRIGAKLQCISKVGAGTTVSLTLSAALAYQRWSWVKRLLDKTRRANSKP
jgi:ligand-binding sensor domain-containing protein/signal transduction histidine kinase